MKCQSCDKVLSDYEATKKYTDTYVFLDLCSQCESLCELPEGTIEVNPHVPEGK